MIIYELRFKGSKNSLRPSGKNSRPYRYHVKEQAERMARICSNPPHYCQVIEAELTDRERLIYNSEMIS